LRELLRLRDVLWLLLLWQLHLPKSTGIAGGGTVLHEEGEATSSSSPPACAPPRNIRNAAKCWANPVGGRRLGADAREHPDHRLRPADRRCRCARGEGLARVNGHDGMPFLLRTSDSERADATVSLRVSDELLVPDDEVLISLASPPSGIAYAAVGSLVSGGVALLQFEQFGRPARSTR
jgi:hypothetical protein